MFGLRQKLLLGFAGLLLIMTVISVESIVHLASLGGTADTMMQGDYLSVLACQKMKEELQLLDSGVEFSLLSGSARSRETAMGHLQRFVEALDQEYLHLDLPGEAEKAEQLRLSFSAYQKNLLEVLDFSVPEPERRSQYLNVLHPLYVEGLRLADEILQMNEVNMSVASQEVKATARSTVHRMYLMLGAGVALAVVFSIVIRRWILVPLETLTQSVRGIEHGNLDQEVRVRSRDELADLAKAFNAMATHLRAVRAGEQARLVRTERTTQLAVDSLPDGVIVLNPDGNVEMVNATAARLFGLRSGRPVESYGFEWLATLWRSIRTQSPAQEAGYESAIQVFDNGQERFFLPRAVPIFDDANHVVGITITLADVTQLRRLDELKTGLLSTTSHELKTPLTSLQMAIHLLLEGRLGHLEPKQKELLTTARLDVDRLRGTVENILDLSRIESGRARMDLQKIPPLELIQAALVPVREKFQAHGLAVKVSVDPQVPPVWVDPARISLVFANLLSNALKYTPSGGEVKIHAQLERGEVEFSVSDTGPGIPIQYRERVFEKFFRVPETKRDGQHGPSGAGLGLAIAKEVVEAHGGRIVCDGVEGKGSTFRFTLQSDVMESEGVTTCLNAS